MTEGAVLALIETWPDWTHIRDLGAEAAEIAIDLAYRGILESEMRDADTIRFQRNPRAEMDALLDAARRQTPYADEAGLLSLFDLDDA